MFSLLVLPPHLTCLAEHADEGELCMKEENLIDRGIIDIDSRHKEPQMCSLYAADIYSSLFARQVCSLTKC